MLVYAHAYHEYIDRARRVSYVIRPGRCRELPDDLARLLLQAHPQKLCDVTDEADPGEHRCALTLYDTTVITEPPVDRAMRPRYSRQKKMQIKATRKRSLRFRREEK
jgi:hypothetical protein